MKLITVVQMDLFGSFTGSSTTRIEAIKQIIIIILCKTSQACNTFSIAHIFF